MIELARYHRLRPLGLSSATLLDDGRLEVTFKRFSVETGKEEVEPERSIITFADLEKKLAEMRIEEEVIQEFLTLKPRG